MSHINRRTTTMNETEKAGRALLAKFKNTPAAQRARAEAERMGLGNPRTLEYLRIQARLPDVAAASEQSPTDAAIDAGVKAFGKAWHKARALARAWAKNDADYAARTKGPAK